MASKKRKKKEKISLEELVALSHQFWGTPGRSSNKIAFVSNKTGKLEIHLLDFDTMQFSQLTNGEYPVSPGGFHKWAPDDSYILFTKDPIPGNEKNNIFSISIPDGTVVQLTDTPESRDDIGEVSHDGKWIVFSSDRSDGINQLFRMSPDGSDVRQLTHHIRPMAFWYDFKISPDDEWIAYTANESENLQNLDVWLVRNDGSETKMLFSVKDGSQEIALDWSRNGKMLLIGSDQAGMQQAGIYYLESSDVKWFGEMNAPETPTAFTGDSEYIVVKRDVDAEMKLLLYEIETGKEIPLKIPPGSAEGFFITANGNHLVVMHRNSTHRMRHLLYDLKSHTYDEIISAEYGRYSPNDFHPDEYISYQSGDVTIHALLYKPKDLQPNTKIPAIILPHGGPSAHYSRLFYDFYQVLTDRGFVLLLPNIRGSTGYGVEFRDACLNDWGGKDLDDIEAGVDYLRSLEFVDPDRIGITGGSYGGYMTFMAVTKKPDLWKAALAYMGISSLKHLYDKCMETFPALSYYLEEQMGKPASKEVLELWEDRSAINFVENMTTTLKIIHGKNDPRCPLEQAELFKDRLLELGKKEGKDFEYVILSDEGHGSMDIDQRTRMYKLTVEFFEKRL
ncbi:MAG: prolyl oligopeptidase family serine peptidase [Candidatus Thorarchaeota archaeon]